MAKKRGGRTRRSHHRSSLSPAAAAAASPGVVVVPSLPLQGRKIVVLDLPVADAGDSRTRIGHRLRGSFGFLVLWTIGWIVASAYWTTTVFLATTPATMIAPPVFHAPIDSGVPPPRSFPQPPRDSLGGFLNRSRSTDSRGPRMVVDPVGSASNWHDDKASGLPRTEEPARGECSPHHPGAAPSVSPVGKRRPNDRRSSRIPAPSVVVPAVVPPQSCAACSVGPQSDQAASWEAPAGPPTPRNAYRTRSGRWVRSPEGWVRAGATDPPSPQEDSSSFWRSAWLRGSWPEGSSARSSSAAAADADGVAGNRSVFGDESSPDRPRVEPVVFLAS